ncbi:uncharacterized protein LOC128217119 [Mya arenaria]|uniref:uncharacterized protein LOC128217028 n=1 Tax=Mya arenaria TaxID=6604 RepID=UPI0022E07668|nr:uncharacterized protein LOC128217028 [Mya arenaria]XP_052779978.1 uncharacterized protein LOC128217119 [Mya arenaria]
MNSIVMDFGAPASMMTQNCGERLMQISDPHGDRSLNFGTCHSEEFDMPFVKKPKTIRDPMSHRIIEKRRRDRMNNCLADLSRLIPTNYLKQGQGRIEKTEIIEMAIRHIKNLTNVVNKHSALKSSLPDRFLGFKECQDEVMRYLVEVEGWDAHDKLCNRLMAHLEQAGEKFRIMNDESLSKAAKEEQYRHVEEDSGRQLTPMTVEPGVDTGTLMADFNMGSPPVIPSFNGAVQMQPQPNIPIPSPMIRDIDQTGQTSLFGGLEALASAQQITQDHLKHDKHLWSLLAAKYEDSKMNVEENSSSPYPSSNSSNKTDSGIKSSTHGSDKVLYKVPMDPNNYQTMDSISDKNDSSVYKFKHKITKRFSEEGKKIPQSDSSSSLGSNENTQRGIKRDMARHPRSLSSYISSSLYSNSDLNGNSSAGDSGSGEEPKITCPLPGFVLHPKGTHYVPMSIHPSNVGNDFLDKSKYEQNTKVFHPISIPVNFGGPLLYMKRVKEWKREISCPSDSRPDSGESRSGGPSSVENLSGTSDNNSTPEEEPNT